MLTAVVLMSTPVGKPGSQAAAAGPVVTIAGDPVPDGCDATCSLREALLAVGPGETVSFDIPGAGPHFIQPAQELPAIGQTGVTVDGYTQSGASPNTAGPFEPGNAVIKIVLDGSQMTGTEFFGLWVGARDITIRGLSIVNFADEGIRFGTFPSAAIQGNYIGILPDGQTAAPNGLGIYLRSSEDGNLIGGPAPAHRNVISGNAGNGLDVTNSTAVVISGNFFGTNASGTIAVPNGGYGVNMAGGTGSTVGGSTSAAGNLISGNGKSGVSLSTPDAFNINVKGNRIGTTADALSPLPNQEHGVYLTQGTHDNTIGGEANVGEHNIIAYNQLAGVALSASAGVNNYIDPSETFSNGGLGTDLLADGAVLPNDDDDSDIGPNSLMNYPVINKATFEGGALHVEGVLTTVPNDYYNMFFFSNRECDPSGFGEGERFLGSVAFNSGPTGIKPFVRDFPGIDLGDHLYITSSASDPESTSEFSACQAIDFGNGTPSPTPSPTATASPTATVTPTPTATPNEGVNGDVDCSGLVDTEDMLLILQYIGGILGTQAQGGCVPLGSGSEGEEAADTDCDGEITAADALRILLAMVGLDLSGIPPLCPPVAISE